MNNAPVLSIEVSFDLICPWCLIGKRHLDAAIDTLRAQRPDVVVEISWRSFPLLPNIAKEGVPFTEFYERRLGGADAVARRQAQVREAGRTAGVEIAYERIQVFPNSLDAHQLVAQAQREGGSARAGAVIDALFDRYFLRGENIGDAAVLDQLRAEHGLTPRDVAEPPVPQARGGAHGVPYFRLNDAVTIEGAHRAPLLVDAMLRALASDEELVPILARA